MLRQAQLFYGALAVAPQLFEGGTAIVKEATAASRIFKVDV
jgi:hypothetical protein